MTLLQRHDALKHTKSTEKCMVFPFSFCHQFQDVQTVHIVLAHAVCQYMNLLHVLRRFDLKLFPQHFPESLISLHRPLRMAHGNQRLHLVYNEGIRAKIHGRRLFTDTDHLCPAFLFLQKRKYHLADIQIQGLIVPPQRDCPVAVVAGQKISFVQRQSPKQNLQIIFSRPFPCFQTYLLKLFAVQLQPNRRVPCIAPL